MNREQRRRLRKAKGSIPMNLQLFAAPEPDKTDPADPESQEDQDTEDSADDETDTEADEDDTSITPAELQRRLRSQKAAHEKELATLKAKYESEKKKASMSADELKEAEAEEKDRTIAELENKVRRMELTTLATNILSAKGLYPSSEENVEDLMAFVVREDEEQTEQAIEALERLVTERVTEQLKKRHEHRHRVQERQTQKHRRKVSLGRDLRKIFRRNLKTPLTHLHENKIKGVKSLENERNSEICKISGHRCHCRR